MPIKDYIIETLNITESDVESLSIQRHEDSFTTHLKLQDKHPCCPKCGEKARCKGYVKYEFKTLPINGFNHTVNWNRRRYICTDSSCKYSFRESNIFTPGHLHISFSLILSMLKDFGNLNLSCKDIAEKYGISTTIVETYMDSFLCVPRMHLPESLGIDELSSDMSKYGSSYLCIMVDNKDRNLVEILPSRTKSYLGKYFESIPKKERDKVKYVTIDMWKPYKDVAHKYLKNSIVCVDPFHVIKELTSSFSSLRISIMNQYDKGSTYYYLLKFWHKLLESDKFELDNEPQYNKFFKQKMNYRDLYEMLLEINPLLTSAYYLKESYRKFNKEATEENCAEWFDSIYGEFIKADIPAYREFIKTLDNWKEEILNSFKRPNDNRKLSNALTENINGRLGNYIRISNGLSNFERFRTRALYALNYKTVYTITNRLSTRKRKGNKRGNYNKHK